MPKRKVKPNSETQKLLAECTRRLDLFTTYCHRTDEGTPMLARDHHYDIMDVLLDDSLGHSLIEAPRGAAKTTLVQSWLEWLLGRASMEQGNWAERHRVLYASNTANQAYNMSNAIKMTIAGNDKYHAVFPKVKPHPEKWSEPKWSVEGNTSLHANMVASGAPGPLLGARAKYLIFDDIADRENMRSTTEREGLLDWIKKVAMPTLVPGGRAIMICTRWHDEDPATWAREMGWTVLSMQALESCSDPSCTRA